MQTHTTPQRLIEQGFTKTFADRFWRNVFTLTYDRGCWLWTAYVDDYGYGQMGKNADDLIRTHVASWFLHFGPVPNGLCVCHTCDTPACVRPDHLWLGTKADNLADMRNKGREGHGGAVGISNSNAKLNPEKVVAIRAMNAAGGFTHEEIGKRFGVSSSAVFSVVHGNTWSHVGQTIAA